LSLRSPWTCDERREKREERERERVERKGRKEKNLRRLIRDEGRWKTSSEGDEVKKAFGGKRKMKGEEV